MSHPRITIERDKRDGKPCIRGMRITVNDVLGWLAHGMTEDQILDEHPGLQKEDFPAIYAFAAEAAEIAYPFISNAQESRPPNFSSRIERYSS